MSEDANEATAGSFEGDRKREAPMNDVEDERVFKLRKKTVAIGLGELQNPGLIPIKLRRNCSPLHRRLQDALPADAQTLDGMGGDAV
ncbi:uncharacterized protein HD556DRAFT_1445624 [Suillus plorans]|uniref:Uncharacterized protein n=1 Tax=Suillus plorans TaxID=116603 RepID=A0A9P7ALU9_9AGAM|nr:uncharacterized protein HD556DRAFT_1445624 [Suillus plorans]KAG1791108.1 hypothetical protein HD556DRAFT_1445624 [Suillus plorans]